MHYFAPLNEKQFKYNFSNASNDDVLLQDILRRGKFYKYVTN